MAEGVTAQELGHRELAASSKYPERLGRSDDLFRCHHYDETDAKFTTPYEWKYCVNMTVGETYEVHWPHSAAGACGTKWQYQTPFYDGVFCMPGVISIGDTPPFNVPAKVGVQGQVFTIVNSDAAEYQKDDLLSGAWMDDSHWVDVAKYVGS